MTSHCIGPAHGGWLTALHCYSFCPQPLYTVIHFPSARADVTSTMSHKESQCSVFGCKTEHKSCHFLPTSELLRTLWITFIFQGNMPQNLPKYIHHSKLLCECHAAIVLSNLTVFVCGRYQSILIDQRSVCEISSVVRLHVSIHWSAPVTGLRGASSVTSCCFYPTFRVSVMLLLPAVYCCRYAMQRDVYGMPSSGDGAGICSSFAFKVIHTKTALF